jgi:hypothetical protein
MTAFALLILLIALLVYLAAVPLGVLVVLPEGQQRSGSAGGSTWSRNRFGAYVRSRSMPVNPNTDLQVAARNRVRALTIAWQNTLTPAQRDGWNLYAANVPWKNHLGQDSFLTGLNHYVRSNTARLQAGLVRLDAAPVIFNLASAEQSLGCTASELTQLLSLSFDDTAPWTSEDGAFQQLQMGMPQNAGISFFGGPWRAMTPILGNAGAPPASPVAPAATFPFAANQRIWVRTRIGRADGRLSEFAQVNFLAGA